MHLQSLGSIVQTGRAFYDRCHALPLYEHCHFVVAKQVSTGMVEPKVITDRRADPERRRLNHDLAQVAMYHVLKSGYLDTSRVVMPEALRDESLLQEIEVISRLTANERAGAQTRDYASLLEVAPIALLVKIADYAVTHKMEDHIEGLVNPKSNSLFRLYRSVEEAQRFMKMEALTGERIYGPVAELFGYPSLSGDIFEHSFRINHPEIHDRVIGFWNDDTIQKRLASTQALCGELARLLKTVFTTYGFDIEIELRKNKHVGKSMRKAYNDLQKYWEGAIIQVKEEEFIKAKIGIYDFETFNDFVALRVIVKSFKGQDIDALLKQEPRAIGAEPKKIYNPSSFDRMLKSIGIMPLRLALKLVGEALTSMKLVSKDRFGCISRTSYEEKSNGYRAFHFDTSCHSQDPMRILPFEVQLKTGEWHQVAEHGKAAHYYYMGGDNEFVDMVRRSYYDIIHRYDKQKKG